MPPFIEPPYRFYRITVTKHNEVRVEQNVMPNHSVQAVDIGRNLLQERTIQTLTMMLRENRLNKPEELRVLGSNLSAVLFHRAADGSMNAVGLGLERALDAMKPLRDHHLRVELVFESGTENLASWPWEYLYCGPNLGSNDGRFLADISKLVLTRNLVLSRTPVKLLLDEAETPLRVLFVASSPDPARLVPVQYEAVLEELKDLAASEEQSAAPGERGRLSIQSVIYDASLYKPDQPDMRTQFLAMLDDVRPHVIHFVGHGRFEAGKGQLAFMDTQKQPDWVTDEELATWLMDDNYPELRLVFLQACESAMADPDGPYRAISGVTNHLACRNIPAVVGMQFEIKSMVASRFARTFYSQLLTGSSLELAVQDSRQAIRRDFKGWAESRAFGLPVFYLRGEGGLLAPRREKPASAGNSVPVGPPAPVALALVASPEAIAVDNGIEPLTACASCAAALVAGMRFCSSCGHELCLRCGALRLPEAKFCSRCGGRLVAPAPAPSVARPTGPLGEGGAQDDPRAVSPWTVRP
jgi:hypothetical protein